ncbi:MAG: hypothetical protein JSV06_04060 [Myxococcales bacterium]|nr:MAG: hypothetical protein JSV06_04060 [Myxococcales bacterium]
MDEEPNAEDREHLSALSIGHFILAGVALFSGIPALVWGVAGAKLVDEVGGDLSRAMGDISGQAGADPFGGGADAMLRDVETLLVTAIVAGLSIAVISAIHLTVVGVKIRQRRWWTFCYLTGWGECLMFPFGTILGIFTIIVLGRPSVKRLFGVK